MPNAKNIEMAKQARMISREMKWHAENPLSRFSAQSPGDIFIPFRQWYDDIADALENTLD